MAASAVLMSGLDYERTVLAGIQIGIMQACLDVVLPYVRERKQFGKPIGSFQLMQAKVADMYVALNSARAYVYQVAKACDAGRTTRFDAAGAILLASENAVKVAGEAIQALGGAGYTKDWPVERYFRDAKLLDIGAGTNEIRRMLIGRELIGADSAHIALTAGMKNASLGDCRVAAALRRLRSEPAPERQPPDVGSTARSMAAITRMQRPSSPTASGSRSCSTAPAATAKICRARTSPRRTQIWRHERAQPHAVAGQI